MSTMLMKKYIEKIKNLDDKNYLFATIAYNIAPTLEKHKPSSIITLRKDNRNSIDLWDKYKKEFLNSSNVSYIELKRTINSLSILFYVPELLYNQIFEKKNHIMFLKKFGYNEEMTLTQCLNLMKKRFNHLCPHEIGIFLGIPLEEVITFMECPNKPCLICGYWKVYNDILTAKETFKTYDSAKEKIIKNILNNISPFETISSSF